MAAFRKRTRASRPFTRSVRAKRSGRRFTRSRRFGGRSRFSGRNGRVLTAYNANNSANNFHSRKLSARTWRNMLWQNTLQKVHWRSSSAATGGITTPAGVGALITASFGTNNMLQNLGPATPFWTFAGGTLPQDSATAVPVFSQSSIILRGGMSTIAFTNTSSVDSVRIRLWACWSKSRPEAATLPAPGGPVPREWDPSMATDFNESYRILFSREVMLLPGSRPMEVKFRHRPKRIDTDEFLTDLGNQPVWIYTAANMSTIDAAAEVATIILSNNLSFSADAAT